MDASMQLLGSLDSFAVPFVSKVLPFRFESELYMLLRDLSEHTKNLSINPSVSIHFAAEERPRTRPNNPRLTLQGKVVKLCFPKDSNMFVALLDKYKLVDCGSKVWRF